MKTLVPLAATLFLSTLAAHCNKRSSSSTPKSTDMTLAELAWGPKSLKAGLETSLAGALGQIFENADKNKDERFTCTDNKENRFPARDCTINAQTVDDSLMCTYSHVASSPNRIMVRCQIRASNWPQLAHEIANVIAPEFIRLGFAQGSSFTSKSVDGKMSCQEANGAWQCSFADFLTLDTDINIPKKQKVQVPEGLKDEFGSPLPTQSKDYVLNLPSGSIKVSSYHASDKVLAEFMKSIASENIEIDDHTDGVECKEGEQAALVYYTGDGYMTINTGLRNLAKGEKPDNKTELAILAAISALNCAEQTAPKIVIRGANLNEQKLAKYQKDAIIVEHAFTSTTIGTEIVPDFKGNTEFRIIAARGANLSDFGVMAEEGEEELLIAPGTLFKVLDRRVQGETTIIEMQQLQ